MVKRNTIEDELKDVAPRGHNRIAGVDNDLLRDFIVRVENLTKEKQEILADIRDVFTEAKLHGYDPKVMRQVIKERAADKTELEEFDMMLDTYRAALGMIPEFERE